VRSREECGGLGHQQELEEKRVRSGGANGGRADRGARVSGQDCLILVGERTGRSAGVASVHEEAN
jgi:hypothetical protein